VDVSFIVTSPRGDNEARMGYGMMYNSAINPNLLHYFDIDGNMVPKGWAPTHTVLLRSGSSLTHPFTHSFFTFLWFFSRFSTVCIFGLLNISFGSFS